DDGALSIRHRGKALSRAGCPVRATRGRCQRCTLQSVLVLLYPGPRCVGHQAVDPGSVHRRGDGRRDRVVLSQMTEALMLARDEDILKAAEEWRKAGRGVALATVVETWGSAPRPVGSNLVIDNEGNF